MLDGQFRPLPRRGGGQNVGRPGGGAAGQQSVDGLVAGMKFITTHERQDALVHCHIMKVGPLRTLWRMAVAETDLSKYATATIAERRDVTDELWVIKITTDCELEFRPGQYVTLGLERNGKIIERPYSICSAPHEKYFELFLERVPEGELSMPLHGLNPGDEMLVRRRCKGLFLRNAPVDTKDSFMVCTVTGIAPCISFIRDLIAKQESGAWKGERTVTVIQGASRSEEFAYYDEMKALSEQHAWINYVATVSRPWDDPEWKGEVGRVEDVLRKYADQFGLTPDGGEVYLCGNPEMIKNSRGVMHRRGFANAQLHEEQYWPE